MSNVVNAQITDTFLGYEDHGILTFMITIKIPNGICCGLGGYALDRWDEAQEKRVPNSDCLGIIPEIINTVGVTKWEDLKGQYIRVVYTGFESKCDVIANLMEDKWLSFKAYFDSLKEKNSDKG